MSTLEPTDGEASLGALASDRIGVWPPGPATPGAIQSAQWLFRPIQFMERCRAKYGPIFSISLGTAQNVVVVGEPAAAASVIGGDPEIFRSGEANLLFRPVLGRHSLLVLDVPEHSEHRRILLPPFKAGHVQGFGQMIEDVARARVSSWPLGEEFALTSEMQAITYGAISRVAFGDQVEERDTRLAELSLEMMDRCDSPFTLVPKLRVQAGGLSPYARLMKVVQEIDQLLFAAIAERRADPLSQMRDDVLSLMIHAQHDDGTPLTDREIRDELLTLLMAGYETTTSALTWAFERLLRSPEVVSRLREELESGDETYLDAVVKESLRERTVVPIVARKLRVPIELGQFELPAGTVVMASVYLVHHDPEIYPEPYEFRPERFLGGPPRANAWIPFGGGVRRCLGANFAQLEMRTVIRTVLTAAKLRPARAEPEPRARRRFTLAPKHGCRVVVDELDGVSAPTTTTRFRRSRRARETV